MKLTDENLRELFDYRDGELLSKIRLGRWIPGVAIGQWGLRGYRITRVAGKVYLLHRLIWRYFNGAITQGLVIDHIDGNPKNNRIDNLRMVTPSENARNSCLPRHNKSGVVGVYLDSQGRGWVAAVSLNNKYKWLGRFKTFEEAVECRKQANIHYGFHPNHGRVLH